MNSGCTLTATGNYTQTAGTTTLVGGTLTATTADVQGGTLTGTGTISGNLSNAGQLTVSGTSATGSLGVTGTFTQTGAGATDIELGGTGAGTTYDQLAITGVAALDGTINATLTGGFTPTPGDAFLVLTFGSNAGTFATENISLGGGQTVANYNASDLTLDHSGDIVETTTAFGLSGSGSAASGGEVLLFGIGLTGDGVGTVTSVDVTLSDLTSATGLSQADLGELRLYSSSDAALGGDSQLDSKASGSVNIGSATSLSASADLIPFGTERFYLVSAVVATTVTDEHALRLGFAAGDVSTSLGGRGTSVVAADADNITIDVVATQLVVATNPADSRVVDGDDEVVSGMAFQTQPAVAARDANGNTDLGFGDNVTASLTGGSGSLAGTTSASGANGSATFADLGYTAATDGEAFTIQFDDAVGGAEGDLPAVSTAGLSADAVASLLAFVQGPNPTSVETGQDFAASDVTVAARDTDGMTDSDYATAITLAVGSGNGTLSAAPGTSVTPASGVSSWTTLSYSAASGFLTSATSTAVTVSSPPATSSSSSEESSSSESSPSSSSGSSGSSGEPTAAVVLSGPTAINFGDVILGSSTSRSFTITNDGSQFASGVTASLPAAQASAIFLGRSSLSLASGASISTEIIYSPTVPGEMSTILSVSGPGSSVSIQLSGRGLAAGPLASLSTDRLDFGSEPLAVASELTLVVHNLGMGDLEIAEATTSSDVFTVGPQSFTVASGSSQTVAVMFARSAPGLVLDTLRLVAGDSGDLVSVALSGRSEAAILDAIIDTLAFDGNPSSLPMVGESMSHAIQVSNSGDLPLEIAELALDPPFQATITSLTVAPAQTAEIEITYAPTAAGLDTASLRIRSNHWTGQDAVVVISAGTFGLVGSRISLPDSLDVGSVLVGESLSSAITIQNLGNRELRLLSVDLEGSGFSLSGPEGNIAPGAEASLEVLFSPTSGGLQLATATLGTDDPLRPSVLLSLTGRGKSTVIDFSGDGVVDFGDFFLYAEAFGSHNPEFDLTGDGLVDFDDFFVFADAFAAVGSGRRAALGEYAHHYLGLPRRPALGTGYPNPFNSTVVIPFRLSAPARASLRVYDIAGQRIRTLVDARRSAGNHVVVWDGRDGTGKPVASGGYLIVLRTEDAVHAAKLALIR